MAPRSKTAAAVLEAPAPTGPRLVEIPTAELVPWPGLNPRTHFDEQGLDELSQSIRSRGVLEPLLVHRPDNDDGSTGRIVAGERRWRAAQRAGLATVPCLVREYSEAEALDVAILENLQRSDLSPIEEARGFRRWLDAEGGRGVGALAKRIGKSQPFVSNRLRLLELPDEILALIEAGTLPRGLARDLLLPFVKIPAPARAELFGTLAKWVGREAAKRALTPDEVARQVRDRAAKLSRAIDATQRIYGIDERPEFNPALHDECTCGGPKYKYGWSESVRCFDEAWWDARQAEAKRKAKEAKRRRQEKLGAAERAGDARVVEMTHDDFRAKYNQGASARVEIERDMSAFARPILLDPAELADAPLVRVRDGYTKGLHCVDPAAIKRAKGAASKERNRRLAERRAARAERDRAEAAKVDVEPWMLAEILAARPQNDTLLAVCREMGVEIGKHGEVRDTLRAMAADQVTLLFKVLALRSRRGDLSWQDPLEKEVDAELMKEYEPGLKALGRAKPAAPTKVKSGDVSSEAAAQRRARAWALAKYDGDRAVAAMSGYVDGFMGRSNAPPPVDYSPAGNASREAERTAYRAGLKAGRTAAHAARAEAAEVAA